MGAVPEGTIRGGMAGRPALMGIFGTSTAEGLIPYGAARIGSAVDLTDPTGTTGIAVGGTLLPAMLEGRGAPYEALVPGARGLKDPVPGWPRSAWRSAPSVLRGVPGM